MSLRTTVRSVAISNFYKFLLISISFYLFLQCLLKQLTPRTAQSLLRKVLNVFKHFLNTIPTRLHAHLCFFSTPIPSFCHCEAMRSNLQFPNSIIQNSHSIFYIQNSTFQSVFLRVLCVSVAGKVNPCLN